MGSLPDHEIGKIVSYSYPYFWSIGGTQNNVILNSYAQLNAKLRWVLFFLLLLAITFCFLSLSCHANKLVLKQNMKDIHSIQNHINTIAFCDISIFLHKSIFIKMFFLPATINTIRSEGSNWRMLMGWFLSHASKSIRLFSILSIDGLVK